MKQLTPIAQALKQWLEDPKAQLPADVAMQLSDDYPFFSMVEGMKLQQKAVNMSEAERNELIEKFVLSVSDPDAAQKLIDPEARRFDDFYPPNATQDTPDTEIAISRFLENYGNENTEEISVLEKLIFNPVGDYSQQLAREEAQNVPTAAPTGDERTDRINRFILSQKKADGNGGNEQLDENVPTADPTGKTGIQPNPIPRRTKNSENSEIPPENALLSESLAKIYIKTGRYERAYEILKRLSLAVPEKNAYFADQLRFLRKLIVADRLRKQQNNMK